MNISQLEISNIRFWKARRQQPNAFSEDRLHHICR